jgi:hypothetical protein
MLYRIFATFLVPVGLAIFGFSRAAMRRKSAADYRQQLAARAQT